MAASAFHFYGTIPAIIALQDCALLLAPDHKAACKGWSHDGLPCWRVVCPKPPQIGSRDTPLAFFIRIWEGSVALRVSWEIFRAAGGPQMLFEIRWRPG